MQSQNRIFDDLVKMMNGIAGTMAGAGREAQESMREKAREFVGGIPAGQRVGALRLLPFEFENPPAFQGLA